MKPWTCTFRLIGVLLLSVAGGLRADVPTRIYHWGELSDLQQQAVRAKYPMVEEHLEALGSFTRVEYGYRNTWRNCGICRGRGHVIDRPDGRRVEEYAISPGWVYVPCGVGLRRAYHSGRVVQLGKGRIETCGECQGRRGHAQRVRYERCRIVVAR